MGAFKPYKLHPLNTQEAIDGKMAVPQQRTSCPYSLTGSEMHKAVLVWSFPCWSPSVAPLGCATGARHGIDCSAPPARNGPHGAARGAAHSCGRRCPAARHRRSQTTASECGPPQPCRPCLCRPRHPCPPEQGMRPFRQMDNHDIGRFIPE
jgi:hypothetical protein